MNMKIPSAREILRVMGEGDRGKEGKGHVCRNLREVYCLSISCPVIFYSLRGTKRGRGVGGVQSLPAPPS